MPVKSYKEVLFGDVIRQEYDFSCGSAAVASLLTYHYGHPVNEETIFQVMFEQGDQGKIRKSGFSLLDMRNYLETKGFKADGFKVPLSKMQELGVPGITLVNFDGYMHFVVIKGMNNHSVILGDPSRGTIQMKYADFERYYSGIVLLIRNHVDIARNSYISDDNYSLYAPAPVDSGVSRNSLGVFSITLPESGEY
ncbi:bacteriocin resistance protein [Vibrio panuliri]|uniref:Bacteriocin resistance protein n=1 Tax=Vibrio panuliri TaxID=1381081 RepID=A0A1Q9HRW4_9VIBR|nr:C39 family peptidase [Vibrio panuliri]OLQ93600.1 bacteriocin resistance protein [Vibrio panuliri]OLQ95128.1 bacteriocin resistance protein [Vibrio panuliri]